MATYTKTIAVSGDDVTMTMNTALASDNFQNDGRVVLVCTGGDADDTITVVATHACELGTLHNITGLVPMTNGRVVFGPFSPARYNDSNGMVTVQHSAPTNVKVCVLQV